MKIIFFLLQNPELVISRKTTYKSVFALAFVKFFILVNFLANKLKKDYIMQNDLRLLLENNQEKVNTSLVGGGIKIMGKGF